MLDTLKNGKAATFIVFQTPEEGIGIPVDLKGFGEASPPCPDGGFSRTRGPTHGTPHRQDQPLQATLNCRGLAPLLDWTLRRT